MTARAKADLLPTDIKAWLDRELAGRRFAGYEELSALLQTQGYKIGKSSLHRYGQKLERKLAAIQASTEAAQAIAASAGDDEDLRSAAVISLVQTEIFDVLLALQEADDDEDPGRRVKLLGQAAKGVAELTRASVAQKRWAAGVRDKIEAKFRALNQEADSPKSNLDRATLKRIQEDVYGLFT